MTTTMTVKEGSASVLFARELRFLGIESSSSFVREPQGHGIAERFVRTLKENLLWVENFDMVEELRQALHNFKDYYNQYWMIGRHGYKTPARGAGGPDTTTTDSRLIYLFPCPINR